MSRIGNKCIQIPPGVNVIIEDNSVITANGPKGLLRYTLPSQVKGVLNLDRIVFSRDCNDRKTKAKHGLVRAIVNNMVIGVSEGFHKDLEIHGVGFKASVNGDKLKLNIGFSHDVIFKIPVGINISVSDNTKIRVTGIDRQSVGQVSADIRSHYPPEPYKGKGIRYSGERIIRKEGKTVQ